MTSRAEGAAGAEPAPVARTEHVDAGERNGARERRGPLHLFFTGFAMGTADIVPGVSGGTIAFVIGIYEELLRSVKTVTGTTLRLLARARVREAFASVPFPFLLPLLAGIGLAAFSLANLFSWLLDHHPVYVWAFFFGLVAASISVVLKRLRRWSGTGIGVFGVATVSAFLITGATPMETAATPLAFFLAGAVAISAMILPGLSGSFLLIIIGKYQQVLDAVAGRDLVTLAPFFLGAVVGIALFSRVLTWLFDRYHDLMILLLAGLMLGSLAKIWPWKDLAGVEADEHRLELATHNTNVLPSSLDLEVALGLLLVAAGAALILLLDRLRLARTAPDTAS